MKQPGNGVPAPQGLLCADVTTGQLDPPLLIQLNKHKQTQNKVAYLEELILPRDSSYLCSQGKPGLRIIRTLTNHVTSLGMKKGAPSRLRGALQSVQLVCSNMWRQKEVTPVVRGGGRGWTMACSLCGHR